MKVSRGRVCLLFGSIAALAMIQGAVAQSPDQLYSSFGASVFYVDIASKDTPTSFVRAGTATLIDPRGYFVTASHVFANGDSDGDPTVCNKRAAYDGIVRLTNERGLTLLAKEYSGAPSGRTDLSILQSVEPAKADELALISYPDVIIGNPAIMGLSKQAVLIAYQYQMTTLFHPSQFGDISIPEEPDQDLVLALKFGFNGQSGGPAITDDGRVVGVLSGPLPPKCNDPIDAEDNAHADGASSGEALQFAQLGSNQAHDLFARIQPDSTAKEIVDALEHKAPIDRNLQISLRKNQISSLSLEEAALNLPQSMSPSPVATTVVAADDGAPFASLINDLARNALRVGLFQAATRFLAYCPAREIVDAPSCSARAPELYTYVANAVLASHVKGAYSTAIMRDTADSFQSLVLDIKPQGSAILNDDDKRLFASSYALQAQLLLALSDSEHQKDNGNLSMAKSLLLQAIDLDPKNVPATLQSYRISQQSANGQVKRSAAVQFLQAATNANLLLRPQASAPIRTLSNKELFALANRAAVVANERAAAAAPSLLAGD